MEKITLAHVNIFFKYKGEYELLFERWANKEDRVFISSKQFQAINHLLTNNKLLSSESLSKPFVDRIKMENISLQKNFSEEAYLKVINGNVK